MIQERQMFELMVEGSIKSLEKAKILVESAYFNSIESAKLIEKPQILGKKLYGKIIAGINKQINKLKESKKSLFMDLQKYQEQTHVTFNATGDFIRDATHCALGVAGEYFESRESKTFAEEIGDMMYYVSEYATLLNKELYVLEPEENEDYIKIIGEIVENTKKKFAYNKDIDINRMHILLCKLTGLVRKECLQKDIDFSYVLEGNIKKLRKRYPNGYNNESAIRRNT